MAVSAHDHIEFYSSKNLLSWNKESDFGRTLGAHGGVWECPDLLQVPDEQGKLPDVLLVNMNPGGPNGGLLPQPAAHWPSAASER
jgi:fructan beta-fructosidase